MIKIVIPRTFHTTVEEPPVVLGGTLRSHIFKMKMICQNQYTLCLQNANWITSKIIIKH